MCNSLAHYRSQGNIDSNGLRGWLEIRSQRRSHRDERRLHHLLVGDAEHFHLCYQHCWQKTFMPILHVQVETSCIRILFR